MTQRRRLDAFLLDAARERGVEVREGDDRSTRVDGAAADVVVGADGANGTTARAFGLGAGIVHGVALRGERLVPSVVDRERYARRAVVELADIPGGYGWVFAKGDHVNVGVGAWQSEGPRLREHLARALRGARRSTSSRSSACAATGCRCAGPARRSRASVRCSSATRPG